MPPEADQRMSAPIIDIKVRFLLPETKVYILFPGDGYRYYDIMEADSSVFLQFPAYPMFESGTPQSVTNILKSVVVSDRVTKWHASKDGSKVEPERNLNEVRNYKNTDARQRSVSFLSHFFSIPKKGDIVIVPPQSQEGFVLFGEFLDDPWVCVPTKSRRDHDEIIPARRVKWVARITRGTVPRWLDRKFPSPNPLRQIEKSLHNYIFDVMYERYFYEGRFIVKFNTKMDKFNSLDSYIINQFFLYIAALHEHIHEENISNIADLSLSDVVASIDFSEDIPDQRISIHSKGYIVNDASNIIPLISGVMLQLALGFQPLAAQTLPPHIVNSMDSGTLSKECVLEIEDEVAAEMKLMGAARWKELCKTGKKANERTGIETGMTAPGGSSLDPAPVRK